MNAQQRERTKAADQIMRILASLEATGSERDNRIRAELTAEALKLRKPTFKGSKQAPLEPPPDIPPKVLRKGPDERCTCLEEQMAAWENLPPIDFSCRECGGTP